MSWREVGDSMEAACVPSWARTGMPPLAQAGTGVQLERAGGAPDHGRGVDLVLVHLQAHLNLGDVAQDQYWRCATVTDR